MTHINTEAPEAVSQETLRTNITVPVPLWYRAKVQAARLQINLQEFAVKAIEIYVMSLEEEYRNEILAEAGITFRANSNSVADDMRTGSGNPVGNPAENALDEQFVAGETP